MNIAELEARRTERKAAATRAREEQYAQDLEALDALETELGDGAVSPIDLAAHSAGLPTMVVVRTPSALHFKRFRDMVRRAKDGNTGAATDLLADVSVAYPDPDTYARVREAFPGVHDSVGVVAIRLAQGQATNEGKG